MEQNACQFSGIETKHIPMLWGQVEPLVQSALDHAQGEYLAEDIYECLMDQIMQLWMIADADGIRGIIVTELQNFPRKRVCVVVLAAGIGVDEWRHFLPSIEEWAYELGADSMRSFGRRGWKHFGEKHGYEVPYWVYEKPLRVDHENTH